MSEEKKPRRFDVLDFLAIAGTALVGYGCWLAWEPAGFFVPGALMVSAAILGARR